MIEFMLTLILGNVFVMAIMLLLIGFMFVLRVMLNIWFDTDFFKKLSEWFHKTNEKYRAKKKVKEEEYKNAQNTILIIDKKMAEFEEDNNVPE